MLTDRMLMACTSARAAFSQGSDANAKAAPAMPAAVARSARSRSAIRCPAISTTNPEARATRHRGQKVHAPCHLADRELAPQPSEHRVRREAGGMEDREGRGHRLRLARVPEAGRRQHGAQVDPEGEQHHERGREGDRVIAVGDPPSGCAARARRWNPALSGAVGSSMYTHRHLGVHDDTAHPSRAPHLMTRGPVGRRGAGVLDLIRRLDAGTILTALLVLGLVLRAFIAAVYLPRSGLSNDIGAFTAWGIRLASIGPAAFYEEGYFSDYPPGYMYVLWVLGTIGTSLTPIVGQNATGGLVKIPGIFADLGVAWLLFVDLPTLERAAARPDAHAGHARVPWPDRRRRLPVQPGHDLPLGGMGPDRLRRHVRAAGDDLCAGSRLDRGRRPRRRRRAAGQVPVRVPGADRCHRGPSAAPLRPVERPGARRPARSAARPHLAGRRVRGAHAADAALRHGPVHPAGGWRPAGAAGPPTGRRSQPEPDRQARPGGRHLPGADASTPSTCGAIRGAGWATRSTTATTPQSAWSSDRSRSPGSMSGRSCSLPSRCWPCCRSRAATTCEGSCSPRCCSPSPSSCCRPASTSATCSPPWRWRRRSCCPGAPGHGSTARSAFPSSPTCTGSTPRTGRSPAGSSIPGAHGLPMPQDPFLTATLLTDWGIWLLSAARRWRARRGRLALDSACVRAGRRGSP